MRVVGVLAALVLVAMIGGAMAQDTSVLPEPFEFPPCQIPEPLRFAQLGVMIENLEFDGNGSLYVTAFEEGLYRLFPDGTAEHIGKSDRPRDPTEDELTGSNRFMGVAYGPDEAVYVAEGMATSRPVDARILRYIDLDNGTFEVFANGFEGANGLAVDDEGNLYLAHGFNEKLWKIQPDGSWAVWTEVPDVVNGVVEHPDGERLVIAPLGDPSNTVLAIPFDEPDAREVLFRFNAPPSPSGMRAPAVGQPLFTKGIDDLAVAPDGRVLISAHMRMQFAMGDPATGEACILLDGTRGEPSSIRVSKGFGDWEGWAFGIDFSGDVWAFDIRTGNGTNGTSAPADAEEEASAVYGTPGPPVVALVFAMCAFIVWRR